MQYITLSGVDGSGKSTQLKLLREHLESQGHEVAYFHAVEFSLANRLARIFKGQKAFEPGTEKAVTQASLFSVLLRQEFLFWDMLRFRFMERHLRLEGYDYLLSDRSFYDSIVNMEYLSSSPVVRFINCFLAKIIPKADLVFFFNLATADIVSRARVPEQGSEYLDQKLALFQTKIQPWKMIAINAMRTQEEVFQDIMSKIKTAG